MTLAKNILVFDEGRLATSSMKLDDDCIDLQEDIKDSFGVEVVFYEDVALVEDAHELSVIEEIQKKLSGQFENNLDFMSCDTEMFSVFLEEFESLKSGGYLITSNYVVDDIDKLELMSINTSTRFIERVYATHSIDIILYDDGTVVFPDSEKREIIQNVAIEYIDHFNGKMPRFVLATESQIQDRIQINRSRTNNQVFTDTGTEAKERLRNYVELAVKKNASDIRITCSKNDDENDPGRAYARMFIDGDYDTERHSLDNYQQGYEMLSAFFMDYAERSGIGEFNAKSKNRGGYTFYVDGKDGQKVIRRIRGEKMPLDNNMHDMICTFRVNDPKPKSFEELNVEPEVASQLTRLMRKSKGITIFSGPMGSGKTTLCGASLMTIPQTTSVMTIEDPVEIEFTHERFDHIQQKQLKETDDSKEIMKSLMRMATKMLFCGELSDKKMTELALDFAGSGHYAVGTTHANSTIGIPERLIALGIHKEALAVEGVLQGLIAQRLLQTICPHCSHNLNDKERREVIDKFNLDSDVSLKKRNHRGCRKCRSGITGRKGFVEVLEVGDDDLPFILSGDKLAWRRSLQQRGMVFIEDKIIASMLKCELDAITVFDEIKDVN